MIDESAAPAPSATSNAGNAQHINVPLLVKSDNKDAARVCLREFISSFIILVLSNR